MCTSRNRPATLPGKAAKMIEAARRYDRVMQVGTQSRSAPYCMKAKEFIDSGKLGRIYLVRVVNQKEWPNVPQVTDSEAPPDLNWDMWTGPAPLSKYNQTLHRAWNHFW